MRYQQPWLFNRLNVRVGTQAFTSFQSESRQASNEVLNTIRSGGGAFFEAPVKRHGLKLGLEANAIDVNPQTNGEFEKYKLRYLRFYIDYNRLNSMINPTEGFRVRWSYLHGGELFGLKLGGTHYKRGKAMISQVIPVNSRLFLAYQLFFGAYKKTSNELTFETERFSLGGANNLRGYREESYFGNYRLSLNFEPRFMLNDTWIGVLFFDAGMIADQHQYIRQSQIISSYGAGVRWLNEVLPLRMDVAYGDGLMVHLSLSQTFL